MLDKLKAFWNRLGPALKIAIAVAVILVLSIGACRVIRGSISTRIAAVEAKLALAEQQAKDAETTFTDALKKLADAKVLAEEATTEANKKLADLARDDAQKTKDLEAERNKTKTMPNEELAHSLGQYIGVAEVSALASGSFSLTRTGAENTRGIFLTSTVIAGKLENCDVAREQDGIKLVSLASELGSTTNTLNACVAAKTADKATIELLQKDVSLWKAKNRWAWLKAGLPAVALGVVIGLVIHK